MSPIRLAVDNKDKPRPAAPEARGRQSLPFVVCLGLWVVSAGLLWLLIAFGAHFI